MCHMLTNVQLGDKITKTKWDRAGGGEQVTVDAKGEEDLILKKWWLEMAVLPGTREYMSMSLGAGRRLRTGHEEGAREPTSSEYFCRRHKIVPGNLVVFRLSDLGLKVQIFNTSSSNICRVWFPKHLFLAA
ncbi:Protein transport protein Sec31A [Hordeum vulgare]|nr:Protein transport protein Sec31A [Hordeum vulgare]